MPSGGGIDPLLTVAHNFHITRHAPSRGLYFVRRSVEETPEAFLNEWWTYKSSEGLRSIMNRPNDSLPHPS